jgi:hypothetical protein
MATSLRAGGVAALAVALGITLAGCGSDSSSSESTAAEETSSSASETPAAASGTTPAPEPAGPAYTIVDYIRDNGITEAPVKRGAPGSPNVTLPMPPGWQDAGGRAPEWAYTAMVYADPAMAADPPTIVALMSKLTGNVDAKKILEYAPGEIQNLPGFQDLGAGQASDLGGFEAFQVGGAYERDNAKRMIAQKTVVIPADDGLYVLQLNADGLEDQIQPLLEATSLIDEQTTITR